MIFNIDVNFTLDEIRSVGLCIYYVLHNYSSFEINNFLLL